MNEVMNSKEYWEKRFSEKDWEKNEGREQTSFFYNLLLKMLPQWVVSDIVSNKMTIADLGCAEGQGTAILSARFGNSVTGSDVSQTAIETARKLYPNIHFEVMDLLHMSEVYDVCVISNVLEHFTAPFEIAQKIAKNSRKYLILMLPFEEEPLMAEHLVSFFYNNIPITLEGKNLVHFSEVDCRVMPNTRFLAKQILLVYSSEMQLAESVSIESMSNIIQLYRASMEEYRKQLDNLAQQSLISSQDATEIDGVSLQLVGKLDCLRNLINAGTRLQFLAEAESSTALKKIIDEIQSDCHKSKDGYNQLLKLYQEEQKVRSVITEEYHSENSTIRQELKAAFEENSIMRQEIETVSKQKDTLKQNLYEREKALSDLRGEYNELYQQFNTLHTTHLGLADRFNNLNDAYGDVIFRNQEIVSSRTWRAANKLKTVAQITGLLNFAKYLLVVRRLGFVEGTKYALRKLRVPKLAEPIIPHAGNLAAQDETCSVDAEIMQIIDFRRVYYARILDDRAINKTIEALNQQLNTKHYKGIVVYPHAVHWEPMQRPQHLLREFAQKGHLCFFCETNTFEPPFLEIEENLYIVNDESLVLPFLQDKHPIVLITYSLQTVFCEFLPQKTLWFDILDRLDFFGLSGDVSRTIYKNLLQVSDIVSYSAKSLLEFTNGRTDVVFLSNAVKISDFRRGYEQCEEDKAWQKLTSSKKPIIGYYGAIEQWFDYDSITYLADHFDCEIVIIGHVGIDATLLKRKNIHLLGRKPYHELQRYSRSFKIGLIPFVINDLTNAVSPVKFFEYCALGIPTVSSAIAEMCTFEGNVVHLYRSPAELVEICAALLKAKNQDAIQREALQIAEENSWEKRVCEIEEKLLSKVSTMQPLANTNNFGMVAVEAVTFFKYDGSNFYSGGAERYLIDLHEVCKDMGVQLRIYQYGELSWLRLYHDIEVVGMHVNGIDSNSHNMYTIKAMSQCFDRIAGSQAGLSIYSPFFILGEKPKSKSIGISHGVAWDDEFCQHNGPSFWDANNFRIDAASSCDHMVSVDTNTANWFQTINYQLGHKITYIPNYVDNAEFSPRDGFDSVGEKVVITYPRRLYGARGLYVVLEVLDDILNQYPNVEFHFVGKGFENDTKHVEKKVAKWKDRVQWYSCPPDEMYEVYQKSDICLIPTMYSEGTSLSCLEALSSGNAVIANRIGGLTDLILNGYNGLLIEPNAEALKEAIFSLLEDPAQMIQLKRTAVATAQAFSKLSWKEKWKKEIRKVLPDNFELLPYQQPKTCHITLHDTDLSDRILVAVVKELLKDNWIIFIGSKTKSVSFERLQFVSIEEDLYFEPSLSLMDRDGTLEQFYIEQFLKDDKRTSEESKAYLQRIG